MKTKVVIAVALALSTPASAMTKVQLAGFLVGFSDLCEVKIPIATQNLLMNTVQAADRKLKNLSIEVLGTFLANQSRGMYDRMPSDEQSTFCTAVSNSIEIITATGRIPDELLAIFNK